MSKKRLRYGKATKALDPSSGEAPDQRKTRVVIYMTEEEGAKLNEFAHDLGMSRSALCSSILERHLITGFSALGGAKLCWQLQKRFEERGHSAKGFYFGVRPLPVLPEEELSGKESKELLKNIRTELNNQPC